MQHQDTVFLKKEKENCIYIEPNKNSEKYKTISDFNFAEYQQEDYTEQLKTLNENETPFHTIRFGSFPKQWITIQLYKQKPYAYYPCDFLNYSALLFTDSTLLEISGEGPQVLPIISFKKVNEKTYRVKAVGRELIFHFTSIAGQSVTVVENYYNHQEEPERIPIYQLMVQAKNIRSLPLIVNECLYNKTIEFTFDHPDLKKFINCN